LRNVRNVRLGFEPDSVLLVELNMRDVKVDSAAEVALLQRLLQSAQRVPGVAYASLQQSVPFAGMSSYPISVAGVDSIRNLGEFDFNVASADYFKVMGTRILRGRAIERTDTDGRPLVMVVGESMANVLWPGQDPIGRCVRVGLPPETAPCRYVVGVAEDIHSQSIDPEPKLFFYYMAAAQWKAHENGLFLRVRGDARGMLEPVRKTLQRDMPGTSFVTARPLGEIVNGKLRSWIVGAKVFTAFGALALLLAAVGLYSVIAYNVTQRKHELGVRLALGATATRILRLVVSESLYFACAGVVIGSIVALWAGKWVAPLLFKQSPRDPTVFALVTGVLIAVAIVAAWAPALRASRLDPKAALQSD
jgi:predicted permease